MVVAVGCGKVQRHGASEIDGELRTGAGIGRFGPGDVVLIGGVQKRGETAKLLHIRRGLMQCVSRVVAGNHKADGAKALFAIKVALGFVDLHHQWCAGTRPGEVRVGIRAGL